jgi:hypothetical protein
MTPKEKATQLVDEFSNECLLTKEGGKVAALIAVYELILDAYNNYYYNYWQEVKQEIEKL